MTQRNTDLSNKSPKEIFELEAQGAITESQAAAELAARTGPAGADAQADAEVAETTRPAETVETAGPAVTAARGSGGINVTLPDGRSVGTGATTLATAAKVLADRGVPQDQIVDALKQVADPETRQRIEQAESEAESREQAFEQVKTALESGAVVGPSALRAAGVAEPDVARLTRQQTARERIEAIPGAATDQGEFDLVAALQGGVTVRQLADAGFNPGAIDDAVAVISQGSASAIIPEGGSAEDRAGALAAARVDDATLMSFFSSQGEAPVTDPLDIQTRQPVFSEGQRQALAQLRSFTAGGGQPEQGGLLVDLRAALEAGTPVDVLRDAGFGPVTVATAALEAGMTQEDLREAGVTDRDVAQAFRVLEGREQGFRERQALPPAPPTTDPLDILTRQPVFSAEQRQAIEELSGFIAGGGRVESGGITVQARSALQADPSVAQVQRLRVLGLDESALAQVALEADLSPQALVAAGIDAQTVANVALDSGRFNVQALEAAGLPREVVGRALREREGFDLGAIPEAVDIGGDVRRPSLSEMAGMSGGPSAGLGVALRQASKDAKSEIDSLELAGTISTEQAALLRSEVEGFAANLQRQSVTEVARSFIPIEGTRHTWADSPNWARAVGVAGDLVFFLPIIGQSSSLTRAGVRAPVAARSIAVAELKAPFTMLRHPLQTAKTALEPLETAVAPSKIPLASVETRFSTIRLPVASGGSPTPFNVPIPPDLQIPGIRNTGTVWLSDISDPVVRQRVAAFLEARDMLTRRAVAGEPATGAVPGGEVSVLQPSLQGVIGPAAVHTTPDLRPFLLGAEATGSEGGLFTAPGVTGRFIQGKATGGMADAPANVRRAADIGSLPTEPVPGAVIIRDPEVLARLQGSNKIFAGNAEIELVVPDGVTLPPPSQVLFTRTTGGERASLAIIGEPLTPAEIIKLKIVGSADTVRQIFSRPGTFRRGPGDSLVDDAIGQADEVGSLFEESQRARRAGNVARADDLAREAFEKSVRVDDLMRQAGVRARARLGSVGVRAAVLYGGEQDIAAALAELGSVSEVQARRASADLQQARTVGVSGRPAGVQLGDVAVGVARTAERPGERVIAAGPRGPVPPRSGAGRMDSLLEAISPFPPRGGSLEPEIDRPAPLEPATSPVAESPRLEPAARVESPTRGPEPVIDGPAPRTPAGPDRPRDPVGPRPPAPGDGPGPRPGPGMGRTPGVPPTPRVPPPQGLPPSRPVPLRLPDGRPLPAGTYPRVVEWLQGEFKVRFDLRNGQAQWLDHDPALTLGPDSPFNSFVVREFGKQQFGPRRFRMGFQNVTVTRKEASFKRNDGALRKKSPLKRGRRRGL